MGRLGVSHSVEWGAIVYVDNMIIIPLAVCLFGQRCVQEDKMLYSDI